jgi:hypothetical protein
VILLLVICYYFIANRPDIQEDTPNLKMGWSPFSDGSQALYAFEIAWGIGFAWIIAFKRPPSLFSAFLRRTPLELATHVAIFIPDTGDKNVVSKDVTDSYASHIFKTLHVGFDNTLKFLFSEVEHDVPGKMEFVPVKIDRETRYIDVRLRRYYFDTSKKAFVPSEIDVGGNARQLFAMKDGLTSDKVLDKESRYGLNVVTIEPPSIPKILLDEFSRIFYVYQNFMA